MSGRDSTEWMETTGPETDDALSATGVGDDDPNAGEEDREGREDLVPCALRGFGSVIGAGTMVLVLRREEGGIAIAAFTPRPSDSLEGDRFVWNESKAVIRVRADESIELKTGDTPTKLTLKADGTLEISGATAIKLDGTTKVVRDGDDVEITYTGGVPMGLHDWLMAHTHTGVTTGAGASGPRPPSPTPPAHIGDVVASATKVTAG